LGREGTPSMTNLTHNNQYTLERALCDTMYSEKWCIYIRIHIFTHFYVYIHIYIYIHLTHNNRYTLSHQANPTKRRRNHIRNPREKNQKNKKYMLSWNGTPSMTDVTHNNQYTLERALCDTMYSEKWCIYMYIYIYIHICIYIYIRIYINLTHNNRYTLSHYKIIHKETARLHSEFQTKNHAYKLNRNGTVSVFAARLVDKPYLLFHFCQPIPQFLLYQPNSQSPLLT